MDVDDSVGGEVDRATVLNDQDQHDEVQASSIEGFYKSDDASAHVEGKVLCTHSKQRAVHEEGIGANISIGGININHLLPNSILKHRHIVRWNNYRTLIIHIQHFDCHSPCCNRATVSIYQPRCHTQLINCHSLPVQPSNQPEIAIAVNGEGIPNVPINYSELCAAIYRSGSIAQHHLSCVEDKATTRPLILIHCEVLSGKDESIPRSDLDQTQS